MGKFNSLLNLRLKSKNHKHKMTALAQKSKDGALSSFSGVFKIAKLSEEEKENISNILTTFHDNDADIQKDLNNLVTITSEVKAITNQAVMLHGERIKKAQNILKNYKDGAFSAWLSITYGNRQTPYNFLQYYEFYNSMPSNLHELIDKMPRQAIYTLASRDGDADKKQEIVKSYKGQKKQELLSIIRNLFPLEVKDKRQANIANQIISTLKKLKSLATHPLFLPNDKQKKEIESLLEDIKNK
ncbi:MAG: hypothetical protein K1060chlam5_00769 [Candidatus Anoxychlamydiales bacterium]|nr:hypothetical protein [Candidatus Anoxychlamydiales bacterium]